MTALRLIKKVENGGVFIPLQEFNNQEVEIELHIKAIKTLKSKTPKQASDAFFSKINKNITVNFNELNVYEQ